MHAPLQATPPKRPVLKTQQSRPAKRALALQQSPACCQHERHMHAAHAWRAHPRPAAFTTRATSPFQQQSTAAATLKSTATHDLNACSQSRPRTQSLPRMCRLQPRPAPDPAKNMHKKMPSLHETLGARIPRRENLRSRRRPRWAAEALVLELRHRRCRITCCVSAASRSLSLPRSPQDNPASPKTKASARHDRAEKPVLRQWELELEPHRQLPLPPTRRHRRPPRWSCPCMLPMHAYTAPAHCGSSLDRCANAHIACQR